MTNRNARGCAFAARKARGAFCIIRTSTTRSTTGRRALNLRVLCRVVEQVFYYTFAPGMMTHHAHQKFHATIPSTRDNGILSSSVDDFVFDGGGTEENHTLRKASDDGEANTAPAAAHCTPAEKESVVARDSCRPCHRTPAGVPRTLRCFCPLLQRTHYPN